MSARKPVEVCQDALGYCLLDADGHPIGDPAYYPTKRAALKALRGDATTKKIPTTVGMAIKEERNACLAIVQKLRRDPARTECEEDILALVAGLISARKSPY